MLCIMDVSVANLTTLLLELNTEDKVSFPSALG